MARLRSSSRVGSELDRPPPYAERRVFPSSSSSSLSTAGLTALEKAAADQATMDLGGIPASPTAVNTALNGRTREELEEMLLTAHNVIRKHENGEEELACSLTLLHE